MAEGARGGVTLRRPVRNDGPRLIAANCESRDYHRPWVEPFTDEAGFDAWFAHKPTGNRVGFLAIDDASGGIAGVVNLNEIIGGSFQCAFLGFYGMVRFAGKGLMTEAVGLVVRFAFGELGLYRLEANVQPDNARSLALVKRLGFRHEGFSPGYLRVSGAWRDHERWAITNDAI